MLIYCYENNISSVDKRGLYFKKSFFFKPEGLPDVFGKEIES